MTDIVFCVQLFHEAALQSPIAACHCLLVTATVLMAAASDDWPHRARCCANAGNADTTMDAVHQTIITELPASEVTTLPLKTSSPSFTGACPYSSCSGPPPPTSACKMYGVNDDRRTIMQAKREGTCMTARRTLGSLRLLHLFFVHAFIDHA